MHWHRVAGRATYTQPAAGLSCCALAGSLVRPEALQASSQLARNHSGTSLGCSALSSASDLRLHSCCCKRLLHECLQDKGRAAVSGKGFCMRTQGPALPPNMQQGGS